MKKSLILLFILFASNSFLFCQVKKDSLGGNYIHLQFFDSFSPEEGWEIHKQAYLKQLKAEGLTANEIEKKITIYEKQKEQFIAQVYEQRRLADIQIKKADEQRKLADIQRAKADEQRKEADAQRKKADEQRMQADMLRKKADEQRAQAAEQRKQADILRKQADQNGAERSIQREEAEKLRKQADIQREKAEEQRKQADTQMAKADEQRKEADTHRAKANEQRKLADIQRAKADEQRKKAEEWRNSFKDILSEKITLSNKSVNIKPILFKVNRKTALLFNIVGKVSSGITLIEIFNPNGEKEGELSLEHKTKSQLTEENEFFKSTSGVLNKTISDSEVGEWQIKISSQKSEGTVNISVAQYVKPTVDE